MSIHYNYSVSVTVKYSKQAKTLWHIGDSHKQKLLLRSVNTYSVHNLPETMNNIKQKKVSFE